MSYVLVTVNLRGTTSDQRIDFSGEMKARGWTKLGATTTWVALFMEGSLNDARLATKQEVGVAAAAAGISKWDAVCMASPESHVAF